MSDDIGRLEQLVDRVVECLERTRSEQQALRGEVDDLRRKAAAASAGADGASAAGRVRALEVVRLALAEIRTD